MPRRARVVPVLALALAAGIVAYLLSRGSSTPSRTDAGGDGASGAAAVSRRNLVESDTESGTLGYAHPQTVYNRLSGTITWLPAVGRVIRPGSVIFEVDDRPVLLMAGAVPAYRTLSAADRPGPDIAELNRDLVALGDDPDGIVLDDDWQAATTAGVKSLQAHHSETETGYLVLGKVVFLPGPQLVNSLDGAVGSAAAEAKGRDPGAPTATTSTSTTTAAAGTTSSGTTTTGSSTTTTGTSTTAPATSTTATVTVTRTVTAPSGTATAPGSTQAPGGTSSPGKATTPAASADQPSGNTGGTQGTSDPGSASGGGSPVAILQTSSTRLVATVDLPATSQTEARLGAKVTVEMPDGDDVRGTVTAVSAVAETPSSGGSGGDAGNTGSGSSPAVPVTITLDKRVDGAGLDQASVSVDFTQERAEHVLSVPVTALIAVSGNSYAVQEAHAPHKLLAVITGLFAAGYVQISGPGIAPGLKVTDSQG